MQSDKSGYAFIIKAQRDGELPKFYIENIANEHHSWQQRVDKVKEMIANRPRERPATKARIETVAGFRDIGDKIAASVAVPCDLVDHVVDKITNLERHSNLFENRRVFLNQNIPEPLKTELTYQLVNNNPLHDDLRDAVLLGLDDESADWGQWV